MHGILKFDAKIFQETSIGIMVLSSHTERFESVMYLCEERINLVKVYVRI
jgi:hypothetical protein